MKALFSKTLIGSAFMLASGAGQSAPVVEALVKAEDAVETVAACLVGTSNSAAISDCLCAAGSGEFTFCADGPSNTFVVHPVFSAAWAAELQSAETSLSAEMAPRTGALTATRWVADARGSCTLTQGSLELALSQDSDKTKLKGVLGARASYSAVYMFPTITLPIVGTLPAADPVRLCSLGQASVNAGLTYKPRPGHMAFDANNIVQGDSYEAQHYYWRHNRARRVLNAALQGTEIGITGGFKWAVPFIDYPFSSALPVYPTLGVKYVLVSAVGAAAVQAGAGKNINVIGVLANTKLTDRVLHLERKNPADFKVTDVDPPPAP